VEIEAGRRHGTGIVARLAGVDERDGALALRGRRIWIRREQLPAPAPGEYYWADLIGLQVETVEGEVLGIVSAMMETGANDVLVVEGERERLIPFVPGHYVTAIDLAAGKLVVDWDPNF
jgi:16S rRNA processing protein RimM